MKNYLRIISGVSQFFLEKLIGICVFLGSTEFNNCCVIDTVIVVHYFPALCDPHNLPFGYVIPDFVPFVGSNFLMSDFFCFQSLDFLTR